MIPSASAARKKRLARCLVVACQAACDLGDLEVAGQVLQVSEIILRDIHLDIAAKREIAVGIIGAHHRLYGLRHADGRPRMDLAGLRVLSDTLGS